MKLSLVLRVERDELILIVYTISKYFVLFLDLEKKPVCGRQYGRKKKMLINIFDLNDIP